MHATQSITLRHEQPSGSRIEVSQINDGIAWLLPDSGLMSRVGTVVGSLFGCAFCGFMTRLVIVDRPGLEPAIFVAGLWAVTIYFTAYAVSGWKSDGAISVSGDTLSITTGGLFNRKKKRAWSIANDVLTVAILTRAVSDNNDVERQILELAVIDLDGDSEEFFGMSKLSDAELVWLVSEVRAAARLPEPPPNVSKDAIVVSCLEQVIQESIEDMEDQVATAKSELRASPLSADYPANCRMTESIADMQQDITSTNTRLSLMGIGVHQFDKWIPGHQVRFHRLVLDNAAGFRASFYNGLGWGVIGMFAGPFVLPVTGFIVSLIAHIAPGDRVRLYLTIVDLFAYGWPLVPWVLFFFPLSMAVVAVRLDAAMPCHEVTLDWESKRLTIRSKHRELSHLLSEISDIVVRPVVAKSDPSTPCQARLEVSANGRRVTLMETDSADTMKELAPASTPPLQRLIPLGEQLATALNVELKIEEPVIDTVDIVGYPFNDRWPLTRRMWRNASARSKGALLAVVAVMAIYFTVAGAYAWQTNEAAANEIRMDRVNQ